ncbi:MAG: hypothetical protein ACOC2W_01030 [bacterium]
MKKKKIQELVDDNNALIGYDDKNKAMGNKETRSKRTTDYNALVHGQNFGHDFLGRFGFYFYEDNNDAVNVEKIEEFINLLKTLKDDMFEFFKQNEINSLNKGFDQYIKSVEEELKGMINESKIQEDKIKDKKDNDDEIFKNKSETEFSEKLKDVADVLTKLNNNDINKLITLLEKKKKDE